jgi:hypothetical protein
MGRHQPVPPAEPDRDVALPGSAGEHALQRHAGSQDRAHRFYRQQVLGRLNDRMVEFIGRQEMVWIATADGHGECDCSFRAGRPGFVCRQHLPHLVKVAGQARPWGTDDPRAKGGDYFGASCEPRPWVAG